jgi:hypothetical protein
VETGPEYLLDHSLRHHGLLRRSTNVVCIAYLGVVLDSDSTMNRQVVYLENYDGKVRGFLY